MFGVGSLAGVATSLFDDGTAKPVAIVVWCGLLIAVAIGQLMLRRRRQAEAQLIG
jgi:hypothetical protein